MVHNLRSLVLALGFVFCWFPIAHALELIINQESDNRQRCSGMYSKTTWDGPVDPYVEVVFDTASLKHDNDNKDDNKDDDKDDDKDDKNKNENKDDGNQKDRRDHEDPIVSVIIFEWKDLSLIGVPDPNFIGEMVLEICSPSLIAEGVCDQAQEGQFVVAKNATQAARNPIFTKAVHLADESSIHYPVTKTGFYCVLTSQYTDDSYNGVVVFRNSYGELSASDIPKLPFYGSITLAYAVVTVYWGFLYYLHRHDILAVQNYITAILGFLVVEMLLTWALFDFENRHGTGLGWKAFVIVVGILNAFRNSFSFFLLLIVCMGYGVVKPTLGRAMVWARWLAVAHFTFGLVYAIFTLFMKPDDAGLFLLFVGLPLAATLTSFYVWTLNSLNATLKDLRERRQRAKELMYRKLWWCILISVFVIFGFFFINSLSFASVNDPDFVPFHWKTRWFILDGWLNMVYFADVVWIAYVWRPTANNRQFAMSDELAQDDDGTFDLGNIGVPMDSDSEEDDAELGKTKKNRNTSTPLSSNPTGESSHASRGGRAGGAATTAAAAVGGAGLGFGAAFGASALPPTSPTDGETVFAVGDDGDRFSDGDENSSDDDLITTKPDASKKDDDDSDEVSSEEESSEEEDSDDDDDGEGDVSNDDEEEFSNLVKPKK